MLEDGLGAIDALLVRRDSLERQMVALVPDSPWAVEVAGLRSLRGLDTLSALGLCAEVGDFHRVRCPGQLMSCLGLVPSENTTGETSADSARSRSPAAATPAGYSSKPPGTTGARPESAASSPAAKTANPNTSLRSAGKPSGGCTAPGSGSITIAANDARSLRSPSLASSPASAGRSPPPTDPGTA